MSQKHLALLRGINVGGKNKIRMVDLSELFVATGAKEVKTHIQSGNVIFDPGTKAESVYKEAVARLEKHMGGPIPIVFRSRDEFVDAMNANPYLRAGCDENELAMMFLRDGPTAEQVAKLDPARSAPDEFTVVGRDVYLRIPTGFADTKLTNQYFDSRLKTVSTARNWRVVRQLAELLG